MKTYQSAPKLLKIDEVAKITKQSKTNIYTLARNGKFPPPRKLTANSSVWLESEIVEWINQRLGFNEKERK
ncbi:MAG: hypothetical protein CO158_10725 [Piscirickettsiaceae bacterium CG_4_9_14_3_um_filter_43_564]|nr:AlpA family phage regulatory protein [Thiomicrospira sp.]OIP93969.1 MAG: hypothetical protein AUK56_10480 [Thiomicrospira sp. CG2_30_44_34]PIQ03037.1 MAG: hypothetical protein COW74_08660 [Piscirickettsiaceae bacterium CG18_big_fil_WC_8_21_14_2_50_44_103]PIU38679.1 MAG: hypothetical protein COT01_05560 [Piscirickettsiaceae bacterium CG07_land_8_20_14_0_80_44_28]PIW57055.1 MAG: hypothetical protein COW14_07870 [Piscirickettsiaceae bacterium CG12_big_fil_rev_8_21_14_0_65_44_934]PIW76801.1 MAG